MYQHNTRLCQDSKTVRPSNLNAVFAAFRTASGWGAPLKNCFTSVNGDASRIHDAHQLPLESVQRRGTCSRVRARAKRITSLLIKPQETKCFSNR